jgi:hypothetical protein
LRERERVGTEGRNDQTMYAHMNIWIKRKKSGVTIITSIKQIAQGPINLFGFSSPCLTRWSAWFFSRSFCLTLFICFIFI